MGIVIQMIGIAAMLGSVLSFQCNKHKSIMILQIIATALFGIQYYLLGAFTGMALDAVGIVRDIVFYHKDKKWARSVWWTVLFAAAMVAVGIVTYQGYVSLLMIAAMALNTVSFSLTKPKLVRSTILISSPLLLVYNILTGSWGGVINEAFSEVSSIVGLLRYDMKKKKGEPAAKESGVE